MSKIKYKTIINNKPYVFKGLKYIGPNKLPDRYVKPDDNEWVSLGAGNTQYFRYNGSSDYIIIPASINGVNVVRTGTSDTNNMFSSKPVKGVILEDPGVTKDLTGLFANNPHLELEVEYLNTSEATHMDYMFYNTQATKLDLRHFDTSNVTKMEGMFKNSSITNINLTSFNTSKVQNMVSMFEGSQATRINTRSFKAYSTVVELRHLITITYLNLENMFKDSKVKIVDLRNFDTTHTNLRMKSMFENSEVEDIIIPNVYIGYETDLTDTFKDTDNLEYIMFADSVEYGMVTRTGYEFPEYTKIYFYNEEPVWYYADPWRDFIGQQTDVNQQSLRYKINNRKNIILPEYVTIGGPSGTPALLHKKAATQTAGLGLFQPNTLSGATNSHLPAPFGIHKFKIENALGQDVTTNLLESRGLFRQTTTDILDLSGKDFSNMSYISSFFESSSIGHLDLSNTNFIPNEYPTNKRNLYFGFFKYAKINSIDLRGSQWPINETTVGNQFWTDFKGPVDTNKYEKTIIYIDDLALKDFLEARTDWTGGPFPTSSKVEIIVDIPKTTVTLENSYYEGEVFVGLDLTSPYTFLDPLPINNSLAEDGELLEYSKTLVGFYSDPGFTNEVTELPLETEGPIHLYDKWEDIWVHADPISDFEGTNDSTIKYIGTANNVIIPEFIQGTADNAFKVTKIPRGTSIPQPTIGLFEDSNVYRFIIEDANENEVTSNLLSGVNMFRNSKAKFIDLSETDLSGFSKPPLRGHSSSLLRMFADAEDLEFIDFSNWDYVDLDRATAVHNMLQNVGSNTTDGTTIYVKDEDVKNYLESEITNIPNSVTVTIKAGD